MQIASHDEMYIDSSDDDKAIEVDVTSFNSSESSNEFVIFSFKKD